MSKVNTSDSVAWERHTVPIRNDRNEIIDEVLTSVSAGPGCLVVLNVEDDRVKTSPTHMKRFLVRSFGGLSMFAEATITGGTILFDSLNAREKLCTDILTALVRSQLLFVMIFGARSARDVTVGWDDIYAGRQAEVGSGLKPGEVAVLRTNLRSQDTFEMCVVKSASAA